MGNDTLRGGQQADILTGGDGSDRFVFNKPSHGRDTITDFSSLEGDKLELLQSGFNKLSLGQLSVNQFERHFDFTNQILSYRGEAIAQLSGVSDLTHSDIIVV